MSTDSGQDDLPKILARAFLRAWKQYCEADLGGKHCEEVARPFLKGLLVEFAKEGVTDEEQLVAAGLRYLISLTRKPAPSKHSMKDEEKTTQDGRWPVHFCINRAPARATYCALFLVSWAFCWSSFSSAAFRGTSLIVSLSTLPVNRNGSAELASNGFTAPRGLPYSASAVASMLG